MNLLCVLLQFRSDMHLLKLNTVIINPLRPRALCLRMLFNFLRILKLLLNLYMVPGDGHLDIQSDSTWKVDDHHSVACKYC